MLHELKEFVGSERVKEESGMEKKITLPTPPHTFAHNDGIHHWVDADNSPQCNSWVVYTMGFSVRSGVRTRMKVRDV